MPGATRPCKLRGRSPGLTSTQRTEMRGEREGSAWGSEGWLPAHPAAALPSLTHLPDPPGFPCQPHPEFFQKRSHAPVPWSACHHGELGRQAKGKGSPASSPRAPRFPFRDTRSRTQAVDGGSGWGTRPSTDQSELSSLPSQEPHSSVSQGSQPNGIPPRKFPATPGKRGFLTSC